MKVRKDFEFRTKAFGGDARYPWEEMMDGQVHHLESGKDFACDDYKSSAKTIRSLAYRQARIRKLSLHLNIVSAEQAADKANKGLKEGDIVLQAVKPTKEQLARWEAKDNEDGKGDTDE